MKRTIVLESRGGYKRESQIGYELNSKIEEALDSLDHEEKAIIVTIEVADEVVV